MNDPIETALVFAIGGAWIAGGFADLLAAPRNPKGWIVVGGAIVAGVYGFLVAKKRFDRK